MEKESVSWQAITGVAFSQWHFAPVRLYYAETCERRGDLVRALGLLEESLKLDDPGYRSYTADSYRTLARLYKVNGQKKQYLATLYALVTRIEPENFEHYQALRDTY